MAGSRMRSEALTGAGRVGTARSGRSLVWGPRVRPRELLFTAPGQTAGERAGGGIRRERPLLWGVLRVTSPETAT